MPSIDFVLDRFSSSYQLLTTGFVDDPVDGITDISATAVFYVTQSDMHNLFRFQTDSEDFNDISYADLRYFTYMDHWNQNLVVNPMNAMLDKPESDNAIMQAGIPSKMLVKHDFMRFLALELFNTPSGVDLFNNESEMLQALTAVGEQSWQNDISGALWRYATTSSYPVPADVTSGFVLDNVSGLKCTTGDMNTYENIPFLILNRILMLHPERVNLTGLDAFGQAPIPLLAGDTISFRFQINPKPDQHLLTGVSPLPGRSYVIKLIVVSNDANNTTPVD